MYLSPFIHVYTERKLKQKLSQVTFFYCSTEGIKFSHDEYEKKNHAHNKMPFEYTDDFKKDFYQGRGTNNLHFTAFGVQHGVGCHAPRDQPHRK